MKTSKTSENEIQENLTPQKIGVSSELGEGIMYDVGAWPPLSNLTIYTPDGDKLEALTKGKADLTDTIMVWSRNYSYLIIGFTVGSSRWKFWNRRTLEAIERFLVEDFAHDALTLNLKRIEGVGLKCSKEATWAIRVN